VAFIRVVHESEAQGLLAKIYDEAVRRAGKVYQVVKLSSLRPEILRSWLAHYQTLMLGKTSLARREKEMIAVAVSRANLCDY
jgi:alkylhydroperoxidase family enzyme